MGMWADSEASVDWALCRWDSCDVCYSLINLRKPIELISKMSTQFSILSKR